METTGFTMSLREESNLKTVMPEEGLGINIFEDRFLYYPDIGVIAFPDIYARFNIEKKKDIYQVYHEKGSFRWVVRGVIHEFLHRILHKEVSLEACEMLDNLEQKGLW
jgi:predicted hydrocarbon binding protein